MFTNPSMKKMYNKYTINRKFIEILTETKFFCKLFYAEIVELFVYKVEIKSSKFK